MKKNAKWRLIFSEALSGAENMAIDEALFTLSEKSGYDGTLRIYFWEPACISLGYFQEKDKALNVPLCETRGIDITRRITGGGAIYHHAEITYSITTTLPNPIVPANVDESYRFLENFIVKGINKCGAEVNYRGVSKPRAEDFYCFVRPSKYDVVREGKKIVGSAQRRSKNLFLQHGSILLNLDELDSMFSVLKLNCGIEEAKKEFNENVTTLDEITGKNLEKYEVAMRLVGEFEKTYGVTLVEENLLPAEIEMSKTLIKKYSKV
ncbi:MAG: lipoate--protein ligase family protein [Candidatus Firestonebacteria bacterium]